MQGFGYGISLTPDELAAYENAVREEGFPGFAVDPPGERETFSTIHYIEPFDARNQRAFGYDMYAEPVCRQAMEQARDSGAAALCGKVVLRQESGSEVQAGTLMYDCVPNCDATGESCRTPQRTVRLGIQPLPDERPHGGHTRHP